LGGTVLYLWVSKSPSIGGFRGRKSQSMTVPSIIHTLNSLDNPIANNENFSPPLIKKNELIAKLSDENITNFSQIQKNLTISNVENFVSCLSQLGQDYQCLSLLNYAENLQQQINQDDWKNIPETINSFHLIQQSIQNHSS
jgi:hypothetical protein